jgi:hypothetical protein
MALELSLLGFGKALVVMQQQHNSKFVGKLLKLSAVVCYVCGFAIVSG